MNTHPQSHVRPFQNPKRDDESFRVFEISGEYSGCSWHFHPEMQLGYVVSGSGSRIVGDSVREIEAGEVVLLGPNLPHVWRFDAPTSDRPVEAIAVHFSEEFLGGDFINKPEMRDLKLLFARASQGLQFVGRTREALIPKLELLRTQVGFSRLLTLLDILNTAAHSRSVVTLCSSVFQTARAEIELGRLQRVLSYVKENFDQPLDRDHVADIAHMSPSSFSRFFKARTGMTFQDFVTDTRIGHACRLLLDRDQSITEIALNCGFADLSTFNRAFQRLRKMTPREYRIQMSVVREGRSP